MRLKEFELKHRFKKIKSRRGKKLARLSDDQCKSTQKKPAKKSTHT